VKDTQAQALVNESQLRGLLANAASLGLFLQPAAKDGGRWHILDSQGVKIFPDGAGAVALAKVAAYIDMAWDSIKEDDWGH